MRLVKLVTLFILVQSQACFADQKPIISIVLDDMGNSLSDLQALSLPQEIGFSILPYTPQAEILADRAHHQGREILLHVPMQAQSNNDKLGKGALMLDMQEKEFKTELKRSLQSLPYIQGINNHMGSTLTEYVTPMQWTMEVLQRQGIYFLDSRTTANTIAQSTAKISGIPTLRRHVFLDNIKTDSAMEEQFQRAIRISKRDKYAVILAHPYPETLRFLQRKFSTPIDSFELITLNQQLSKAERLAMAKQQFEFQQAKLTSSTSSQTQ